MDKQEFIEIIKKLEKRREKNPSLFQAWVVLLVASGYLYLLLLLVLAIGFVPLGIQIIKYTGQFYSIVLSFLGVFIFIFWVGIIFHILSVRFDKPKGYILKKQEAPLLFDKIGEICGRFRTLKIHTVLLTDEFNSYITQTPSLGIFGMYRNTLVISIPYMAALTKDQFDSVLAHELAHISKLHGRIASWIHRIRGPWQKSMGSFLFHELAALSWFRAYFVWFINHLNAADFVLRRVHETVADRMAAEVVGAKPFADGLALTGIIDARYRYDFLQRYLSSLIQEDKLISFIGYAQAILRSGISQQEIDKRYLILLYSDTDYFDTHPCFKDRIKSVQQPCEPPNPPDEDAIAFYSQGGEAAFIVEFERYWQNSNQRKRTKRLRYAERYRDERETLLDKQSKGPLSVQELDTLAHHTRYLYNMDQAENTYRQLRSLDPYHPAANYYLGMLELQAMRLGGVDMVRQAINRDITYFPTGSIAIYECLLGNGMPEEAEKYKLSQAKNKELFTKYHTYMNDLFDDTGITNLDLDPNVLDKIRGILKTDMQILSAYVSKKKKQKAYKDIYVLLLKTRSGKEMDKDASLERIEDEVRFQMDKMGFGIIIRTMKGIKRHYQNDFITAYSIKVK